VIPVPHEQVAKSRTYRFCGMAGFYASMMVILIHGMDKEFVNIRQLTPSASGHAAPSVTPHIRPIIRGKAGAHTEFGAKLEISVVDGFVYSERLDFNSFHEEIGLEQSLDRYRERFGNYPASVIADKINRNRSNYQLCKSLNIRISGPRLGRLPKDENEYRGQKHLERLDAKIRNIVEGRFGTAKRKHGLNRVYAKQPETAATVITLNLLVLNLEHMLRILYSLFSRFSRFDLFITVFVPV
jgi:IS5 family transposase